MATHKDPCIFNMKGICRYGNSCRFAHIDGTSAAFDGNHFETVADKPALVFCPQEEIASYMYNMVCPLMGPCPYGDYCKYLIHMKRCEMCDVYCLHPNDEDQRRAHLRECLAKHERDMEHSFAMARSSDKVCGICMEVVIKKKGHEKRFGIMSNCAHIYCLTCIRQWRSSSEFDQKLTRGCPECRIVSDYICPSAFWVETKEEREKLLKDYLAAMKNKDCKHFKKGVGVCPFGNKCFYKHQNADGHLVDIGDPKPKRRKSKRPVAEYFNTDLGLDWIEIGIWPS